MSAAVGRRLVLFPMHTFEKNLVEGFRTRDGHLLRALARRDDVERLHVIDRPVTRPEIVMRRRSTAAVLAKAVQSDELLAEKVQVVDARSTRVREPIARRKGWWASAYRPENLTTASLRRVTEALTAADGVITWVPTASPLWSRSAGPVLFDVLDNWLIHPQLGGLIPDLRLHYGESFGRASVVSANSEATGSLAQEFGRTAVVVPNGVDPDGIRVEARRLRSEWVDRLSPFPRPWLVYAGKMQQRVDAALLARLAEQTSGTVILAGPVMDRAWMRRALDHWRVHWVGDLHYSQLPGLLACADVALIPHRVGEGEVGGDPIKLYEYGATGCRVVSTAIIGWQRFGPLATVTHSAEQFLDEVTRLAIDERDFDARVAAQDIPIDLSWDYKAERLLSLIEHGTDGPAT